MLKGSVLFNTNKYSININICMMFMIYPAIVIIGGVFVGVTSPNFQIQSFSSPTIL